MGGERAHNSAGGVERDAGDDRLGDYRLNRLDGEGGRVQWDGGRHDTRSGSGLGVGRITGAYGQTSLTRRQLLNKGLLNKGLCRLGGRTGTRDGVGQVDELVDGTSILGVDGLGVDQVVDSIHQVVQGGVAAACTGIQRDLGLLGLHRKGGLDGLRLWLGHHGTRRVERDHRLLACQSVDGHLGTALHKRLRWLRLWPLGGRGRRRDRGLDKHLLCAYLLLDNCRASGVEGNSGGSTSNLDCLLLHHVVKDGNIGDHGCWDRGRSRDRSRYGLGVLDKSGGRAGGV